MLTLLIISVSLTAELSFSHVVNLAVFCGCYGLWQVQNTVLAKLPIFKKIKICDKNSTIFKGLFLSIKQPVNSHVIIKLSSKTD